MCLPFANFFQIQTANITHNLGGIFGIGTSLDYYYKKNNYISLGAGTVSNHTMAERIGPGLFEDATSDFINVRNNFNIGSFDFGYGVNVAKYHWDIFSNDSAHTHNPASAGDHKDDIGIGLSFISQFRFGEYFRMGIIYQPNVLNISTKSEFDYQHYIGLELLWKIRLGRIEVPNSTKCHFN